jgi:hypothetical protein
MNKPTIFLLGTKHFSNNDNDNLFQVQTENIFTEKRQQELQEVIGCIQKFQPTKIALEFSKEYQPLANQQYESYRNGEFSLVQNECYHIGFRLAEAMGHNHLFGVDWNHDVEGVRDIGLWANENKSAIFDEVTASLRQQVVDFDAYFKNHTVREFLLWLNNEENMQYTQETYAKIALVGTEDDPAGAQWTAHYWHYRNILIYKNIMELVTSKDDRIFVLYGAGHLPLLLQFLRESQLCNVELASDYLGALSK